MKQLFSSRLMRISMVMVLALGFCNDTNAQFGGLLNAAKRKVKEVVTNKANDVINNKASDAVNNKASDAVNTAVNGNIIPLYYINGNPMENGIRKLVSTHRSVRWAMNTSEHMFILSRVTALW